jgi:hypothetical protein
LLLHDHLEEVSISVEVEVDDLLDVVFGLRHELGKQTFNDLSLSASSESD